MLKAKNGRPAKPAATMRDVARLADVSQSTVSRVLSATSPTAVPISEDTAQRVHEAVKQLRYSPNLTARSLRGQKTHMIAMMIADIANPYYQFMVRKVQDVARKYHYDVLIANSDHDKENEMHFLEGIRRRPVDGVIITPYHLTADDVDLLIQQTGVSVVALSNHINHPLVDGVFADDGKATYEVTQWLIQQRDHKRIAFIGVPGTLPGERRWKAFAQAVKKFKLPLPSDYFQAGDFTTAGGEKAMRALLMLPEPPTAVVAANDLMALGCMVVAHEMGFKVPQDVAVVGFDNIPEAGRSSPKLTTIAQYPSEMGERLAESLFERIEARETGTARLFEVPCNLIVRESA